MLAVWWFSTVWSVRRLTHSLTHSLIPPPTHPLTKVVAVTHNAYPNPNPNPKVGAVTHDTYEKSLQTDSKRDTCIYNK